MDHHEARIILGVANDANEQVFRAAHRLRIRSVHPDAGGSSFEAALVNEALHVLLSPAKMPPPEPASTNPAPTPKASEPEDVDRYFVIREEPADLLARLANAGHSVGEVVFVDPHGGLLEIVVGDAPAVGQLAVTVGDAGPEGTPVSFTLDALGVTPAPPIGDVVDALMAALEG